MDALYIALSIPIFFVMIGVELWVNTRRGDRGYRFRDRVEAAAEHTAVFRLHLAPELGVERSAAGYTITDEDGRPLVEVVSRDLDLAVGASAYHPRFGVEIERPCLSAELTFRDELEIEWSLELL